MLDDQGTQSGERPIALLFGDNKAAVILTKGLKGTLAIRHICTSFHQLIDEVEKGSLRTYQVLGKDMLADGLTKALCKIRFEENRRRTGIKDNC